MIVPVRGNSGGVSYLSRNRSPTMYIPPHFAETRPEVIHRIIREHPLGMIVHHGSDGFDADHIPFELDPGAGALGLLSAHVARANPLWQRCPTGTAVMVVFRSAQAYVSPNWYPSKHETHRQVPTWNYEVVHAHGTIAVRDDGAFDVTGMMIWSTDTARVGLRGGALHRPLSAPGVETVSPLTDDPLLAPSAWAGTGAAGGLDMIVVVGPLRLAAEGAVLREGLTLGTADGHALHTAGYVLAGLAPGGTRGDVNDSAPLLEGWEALVRLDARTSASALGPSAWTAGANLAVAYALEPGARFTAEIGPQVVHLSNGDTTTPGVVGRVSFVLGL